MVSTHIIKSASTHHKGLDIARDAVAGDVLLDGHVHVGDVRQEVDDAGTCSSHLSLGVQHTDQETVGTKKQ